MNEKYKQIEELNLKIIKLEQYSRNKNLKLNDVTEERMWKM